MSSSGNIHLDVSSESTPEKTECDCCCDTFNSSQKKAVQCPNPKCDYVACKSCVRTYLLSTSEAPHCMSCKSGWNERFLTENLNASFMNGDYKKHRKNLLLEREISRLPETMPAVVRFQEKLKFKEDDDALLQEKRELNLRIKQIEQERHTIWRKYHQFCDTSGAAAGSKEGEGKKYTFPCPDENCRGFLSSAYKCEICKYYACPKCLVLTGKERHDPDHVCDEELVKTATLIRESSKACPNCFERIIKSSGCDQMWCTNCHTAFSWKTGKIDTGIVHNPHFFQYQQQHNTQIRNPNDVICGGLPGGWWQIRGTLRRILSGERMQKKPYTCACSGHVPCETPVENNEEYNIGERKYHRTLEEKFTELFQTMRHINGHSLPTFRQQVRHLNDNEELRIQYSLNRIDKETLGKEVIKRDKKRRKMIEEMHLYELIVSVGNDLINHLANFLRDAFENSDREKTPYIVCEELTKKFKEFDTFIDYINKQFMIISVTYSQIVDQFEKNTYMIERKKFKKSDLETSA